MSHAKKKAKHEQRDQRAAERVDPAKRAQRIAEDHPRWPLPFAVIAVLQARAASEGR